jgi:hypothetical protein
MPVDIVINDNAQPKPVSKYMQKRLDYFQEKYGINRIVLEGQSDGQQVSKSKPLDGMTEIKASNKVNGLSFTVDFRR